MDKNFSIRLDFDNVPTFGEYLQDQPEVPDSLDNQPKVEEPIELEPDAPEPAIASEPVTPLTLSKKKTAKKTTKKTTKRAGNGAGRDIQALMSEIKRRLIAGESDMIIAENLNLGRAEYRRLKTKVYDQEVDSFVGKSAEEQYVDYCFDQQRCLDDLDEMARHFKGSNNYNAMVGAIRAKSQIMEAIHKTGVAMGVIKQETSWDREVAGVRMSDLDNKELRDTLATEIRALQHVMDRFGDAPIVEVTELSPMKDPTVERVKQ